MRAFFWLPLMVIAAMPAMASSIPPGLRTVLAAHDPERRLPHTEIRKLGTVRAHSVTYSIFYLRFVNRASRHGQQRIAVIKNGTQFAGAYQCLLGPDEGKLVIGKDRLTVRRAGMTFVIRFDEKGPSRNKYFCAEGSGWEGTI